ncbi:MAG TPA: hypothetical protein VHF89_07650 [Solirubrobacteraceae bacterium]|nr:hypothetical protein [Solirubrobacteraceae bacterium]
MSPTRLTARRIVRRLLLLPLLVAALLVVLVPAGADPKWDNPGNGTSSVETHQPYGVGNGRKFK